LRALAKLVASPVATSQDVEPPKVLAHILADAERSPWWWWRRRNDDHGG
jgi:hypothetical protein